MTLYIRIPIKMSHGSNIELRYRAFVPRYWWVSSRGLRDPDGVPLPHIIIFRIIHTLCTKLYATVYKRLDLFWLESEHKLCLDSTQNNFSPTTLQPSLLTINKTVNPMPLNNSLSLSLSLTEILLEFLLLVQIYRHEGMIQWNISVVSNIALIIRLSVY